MVHKCHSHSILRGCRTSSTQSSLLLQDTNAGCLAKNYAACALWVSSGLPLLLECLFFPLGAFYGEIGCLGFWIWCHDVFLSVFIRILEKNNTPEKREKHLIHIYVGVLRGFNEIRCHHYGEPNVKQCYFSPHFANCWSSCKLQWR